MADFRVPDSESFNGYINKVSGASNEVDQKTSSFIRNWQVQINGIFEFLQEMKQELAILAQRISELVNFRQQLISELNAYKQQLEMLKAQLVQLQQEKIMLEEQLRKLQSSDSDDKSKSQMIAEIRRRIDDVDRQISDVSGKANQCIAEIEKLQQQLAEVVAEIEKLTDKYETVNEHCRDLYDHAQQSVNEFNNFYIPGKSQGCTNELNSMADGLRAFSNWMEQSPGWGVRNG